MKKDHLFNPENSIQLDGHDIRVDLLTGSIVDNNNNLLDHLQQQEIVMLCLHFKHRLSTKQVIEKWKNLTGENIVAGTVDRYRHMIRTKLKFDSGFDTLKIKRPILS